MRMATSEAIFEQTLSLTLTSVLQTARPENPAGNTGSAKPWPCYELETPHSINNAFLYRALFCSR